MMASLPNPPSEPTLLELESQYRDEIAVMMDETSLFGLAFLGNIERANWNELARHLGISNRVMREKFEPALRGGLVADNGGTLSVTPRGLELLGDLGFPLPTPPATPSSQPPSNTPPTPPPSALAGGGTPGWLFTAIAFLATGVVVLAVLLVAVLVAPPGVIERIRGAIMPTAAPPAIAISSPVPTPTPTLLPPPTATMIPTDTPRPTAVPTATPVPTAVPTVPPPPTWTPSVVPPGPVRGPITIWDGYRTGDNEEKTINQLVAAASKQYPDAKITMLEVPFDQLFTKFETEAATGGGPDMYIAPNDSLGKQVRAGLLAPLDSMLKGRLDAFSKTSVLGMTVDGQIYGVPMSPKVVAMYYNKMTVPVPPATTDDLMVAVKTGKRVGIPNSAYHTFGWWRAFGGQFMDDKGKCIADQGGVADAYNYLLNLRNVRAQIAPDADLDAQFQQGNLDIYFNGPWVLTMNEGALGRDRVGVALMPKGPKGEDAGPLMGVDGWYINASSKNKESALNLALYFASQEGQTTYANIAADPPARMDIKPIDSNVQVFAIAASNGIPRPQVPQFDNFWSPFSIAVTQIFQSRLPPDTAIKNACAAMNKANPFP